jgi:hypothetical protein
MKEIPSPFDGAGKKRFEGFYCSAVEKLRQERYHILSENAIFYHVFAEYSNRTFLIERHILWKL